MSAKPKGASDFQGAAGVQSFPQGSDSGRTRNLLPPQGHPTGAAVRAVRYQLLAAARALFLYEGKQAGLTHPANSHRTAKCMYTSRGADVPILQSEEHGRAFYGNLVICGSVWACPVCAAKIQERRREEIAAAIVWAHKHGLQPVMVTLTFPHYAWDSLSVLVKQQADALTRLRRGNPWTRFTKSIAYQGLIRGLEVTFGENGWHPHTHELWFVSRQSAADLSTPALIEKEKKIRGKNDGYPELLEGQIDMRSQILKRWRSSCARAGLLDLDNRAQVAAFDAHAVDVKGWCDASDYLAKQDESRHWGADRELAKASSKAGRAKGKHPFGLLADAAEGNRVAGAKYLEYTKAMFGKSQLFWSNGLKAKVGIDDLEDKEVAKEMRDKADVLGRLSLIQWRRIRSAEQRSQLLEAAETGGWPAVLVFLAQLQKKPPTQRGPRLIGSS
jgi:hypothetical protein